MLILFNDPSDICYSTLGKYATTPRPERVSLRLLFDEPVALTGSEEKTTHYVLLSLSEDNGYFCARSVLLKVVTL